MERDKNHINPYWHATADGYFVGKGACCPENAIHSNRIGFPVITMTIATVYTCFFFFAPAEMIHRLCLLPLDDFTLSHLIRATLAGIFFHPGSGHFLINMVFLWGTGAFVEPRLTPGQYLAAVLLGSVLSRLISLNLIVSQVGASSFNLLWCQPTGASGAIAGLMGCLLMSYWGIGQSGRGRIPCHPFGPRWVSTGAMVLIVLFLALSMAGFNAVAFDPSGMAIFRGHAGGMLGGLVLALVSNLQDDNPDQRREDVGKSPNGGLKRGADDRCHLELIIS